jgi:hypothetical protein
MKQVKIGIVIICIIASLQIKVLGSPVTPAINTKWNTTQAPTNGTLVNYTGNNTYSPSAGAGHLYTINFNSIQQDIRWKGFVGNITITLSLDDNNNYTIFEWPTSTTRTGEVYTTRAAGVINWAGINCSTMLNITNEEIALAHTSNPTDNISATFNNTDNKLIYVGTIPINANTCPTTNLNVNSSRPSDDKFEEVLLHDGQNMIYAVQVENNSMGYREDQTFDFQLIVPEVASSGFTSMTLYYFYSELE